MSDEAADYRIPLLDAEIDTADYRGAPVDRAHPLYDEPLVDVAAFGLSHESYYAREDGGNAPYGRPLPGASPTIRLRRSVAEKLARVDDRLRPLALELLVLDGYRTPETQRAIWAFHLEAHAARRPELSREAIAAEVRRFVSEPTPVDPEDPRSWPTHVTGAAVDLTLRDRRTGAALDLGAAFDEISPMSRSDALERSLRRGEIGPDDPALRHRRLLHWAMTQQGFVNYPSEFWHFDWGNQMYLSNLRALGGKAPERAWYGCVTAGE